MWVAVVVGAFLVAQPTEGEGEGADPCAPVCADASHLSFCDAEAAVSLDCATVAEGARCGILSDGWGADCLLPVGAACDPDYGFGESRCDDGLSCRDGVCAIGEPADQPPLQPTAGTTTADDATTTSTATTCASCANAGFAVGPLGLLWRLRRRRPSAQRRGRP